MIILITHIDHISSRDGGGGGAQEDAADLHAVPDPGAGEGDSITIIHTLAPGSVMSPGDLYWSGHNLHSGKPQRKYWNLLVL